jgi:hypothetical protein
MSYRKNRKWRQRKDKEEKRRKPDRREEKWGVF